MPPKRSPDQPTDGVSGRWVVLVLLLVTFLGLGALIWLAPWSGGADDTPANEASDDAPSSSPPGGARLEGGGRLPMSADDAAPGAAPDAFQALSTEEGVALVRAATALRRALRLDPELLQQALALLLDPGLDTAVRARLAFVLGTLDAPGVEAALIESIRTFGRDVGYLRDALLALGAQREPHDRDHVFAMGERPFGVVGPGGLGITIRRNLENAEVRTFLVTHLEHAEDAARYAAARALDASVESPDVRAGLHAALAREETDAVAARVAEPLGRWAAGAKSGPERDALLELLIARSVMPDLDEMRFRLEKDLGRTALPEAAWSRLLGACAAGEPLAIRLFAVTTLGSAADRADAATLQKIRTHLGDLVTSDGDAGVRDGAARQLGRMPASDSTREVLERAALRDAAWNVRYTALESLARQGDGPALRRVLAEAIEDGEPRVADLAREIQARLPDR